MPHQAAPVMIADVAALRSILANFAAMAPRMVSIGIADEDSLEVGIGGRWAFLQHTRHEPWMAEYAVPPCGSSDEKKPDSVWFPIGGDATEIGASDLMDVEILVELLIEWFHTGKRPSSVYWGRC
jgi:hypothetical protein